MDNNFYLSLKSVLKVLGWHGDVRQILEIAPHLAPNLTLSDLRNLLVRLGFPNQTKKIRFQQIHQDYYPCLYISSQGGVYLGYEKESKEMEWLDTISNEIISTDILKRDKGQIVWFEPDRTLYKSSTWFGSLIHRFRKPIYHLVWLGLICNSFSLLSPFFVRAVYDQVVPAQSEKTLLYLTLGVAIALMFYQLASLIKGRILAHIGGRIDMLVGSEVMRRLLHFPAHLTEGATVSNQMVRLQQFESIRDIFIGSFAQLLIDGPFVILFIVALAFLGGPIAVIPVIMIALCAVTGMILLPILMENQNRQNDLFQDKQSFILESVGLQKLIKQLGATQRWMERFEKINRKLIHVSSKGEDLSMLVGNIGQVILRFSGLATIIWGTLRVMDNQMSVGSLIAVVLLVWRAFAPIQSMFQLLTKYPLWMSSINLLNTFMRLPNEERVHHPSNTYYLEGHINIQNLFFRYGQEPLPALQGVSLEAHPGEMVAILGNNGSGKTTLFRILMGFYTPQGGVVTMDNQDIRQHDPLALRQAIAYVPQRTDFFHGSISQNFRLVDPAVTLEEIEQACADVGLLHQIKELPKGFNTKLDHEFLEKLSFGFKQKLSLARAFLKKSKVMLLDEPGNTLDLETDEMLKKLITTCHGEKTIIVATHRPSLIRLSDRLLVLKDGAMQMFGPTPKVLQILREQKS